MLKIVTPKGLKAEIEKYFQQKEVKGPFIVVGYTGIGKTQISFPLFYEQGCNLCREFIMEGEATDQEMLAALEEYKGQRGCFERTIMNEGDARFLLEKGYDVVLLRASFEEWREWTLQKNSKGKQNVEQWVIDFLDRHVDMFYNVEIGDEGTDKTGNRDIYKFANPRNWFKVSQEYRRRLEIHLDPKSKKYNPNFKLSLDDCEGIIGEVMGNRAAAVFKEYVNATK